MADPRPAEPGWPPGRWADGDGAAGREPAPELLEAVRSWLVRTGVEPSPSGVAAALRAEGGVLGDAEVLAIARVLRADLAGAGPLDPLLADPDVTDVLVNGPDQVWVDAGDGLRRTGVTFADDDAVRRLAQRLAASAGRRLDDAVPYCDARLDGGVRLHAVLRPVAPEGTCLSLRLARSRVFSLAELVEAGSLPPVGAQLLGALIAARAAFLIAGGTGSGKTTLLNALLSLVDPRERIVLVEESTELRPEHPHVVRLQSRPPGLEGTGAVPMRELVRQALRMRPDRLVVGEVRGAEAAELLSALNTGHDGGCGTLHANAAADVPARLEALGCAAGLSREAVHSLLAATRVVVVRVTREPRGGLRRVAEVCVLAADATGLVRVLPAVAFAAPGPVIPGPGAAELAARLGPYWPTALGEP
ncbi:TadA family conjugal transfer-associated ATPase [Allonocardiopsis opalescens]|uniref:Pilus assembly protein CpaF n=1 Tax=Allonocardiopsis opalescens TaxID=1144618 RepID=A0A2T0Q6N7_9ACTN|nr:TadA family conjugal transfer-associated ATPase [Allonocardiopsis opalescens]PRX99475.1 pilus assembly protein CpaF [Allonocardiopsis opalescens]